MRERERGTGPHQPLVSGDTRRCRRLRVMPRNTIRTRPEGRGDERGTRVDGDFELANSRGVLDDLVARVLGWGDR